MAFSFSTSPYVILYCFCGLYAVSAVLSFVILAVMEIISYRRYHKNHYK